LKTVRTTEKRGASKKKLKTVRKKRIIQLFSEWPIVGEGSVSSEKKKREGYGERHRKPPIRGN